MPKKFNQPTKPGENKSTRVYIIPKGGRVATRETQNATHPTHTTDHKMSLFLYSSNVLFLIAHTGGPSNIVTPTGKT